MQALLEGLPLPALYLHIPLRLTLVQEDPMICKPCKENHHEDCKGGTWCDCQHADQAQFPAGKGTTDG